MFERLGIGGGAVKSRRGPLNANQFCLEPKVQESSNAPGRCTDCGSDAYIRLGAKNGEEEWVCAHCYSERSRPGRKEPAEQPLERAAE
jgi:hypothetical protein